MKTIEMNETNRLIQWRIPVVKSAERYLFNVFTVFIFLKKNNDQIDVFQSTR